jgi:hypothetical protein
MPFLGIQITTVEIRNAKDCTIVYNIRGVQGALDLVL